MALIRLWLAILAALWLGAGLARAEDKVILYSSPDFKGDALEVRGDVANLRDYDFNDEVSSMVVLGGEWAIYPDKNYGGVGIRVPPGNYPNMESVLFKNNDMSSIKLVRPTPPPPPPKAKLPDLQRKADARSGYLATIAGEGPARTVSNVTFRGITAYVTVTNSGEADADATTLTIEPADSMADFRRYISPGLQPCPAGQVPWPAKNGQIATCTAIKSGDIVAKPSGAKLSCAVPALAIGSSARCVGTLSVLYNWVVPELGDWHIVAVANAGDDIKESSKKNNGAGAEIDIGKDDLPAIAH